MNTRDNESPDEEGDAAATTDDLVLPSEILEGIPEDEREDFSRRLVSIALQFTREEHYSSTLPSHKEAAGWNALVPGTAERIFDRYEELEIKKLEANTHVLAIAEEKFRRDGEMERKQHDDSVTIATTELKDNADKVKRGQWFAFLAFIFVTVGGFYMVHLGHDTLGIAILVFEAGGIAGLFLNQFRREDSYETRTDAPRDSSR